MSGALPPLHLAHLSLLSPAASPSPPVLQEPEAPAAAASEEKEAPKGIPSLGKPKKKEEGK